jgi:hypothetical protein
MKEPVPENNRGEDYHARKDDTDLDAVAEEIKGQEQKGEKEGENVERERNHLEVDEVRNPRHIVYLGADGDGFVFFIHIERGIDDLVPYELLDGGDDVGVVALHQEP